LTDYRSQKMANDFVEAWVTGPRKVAALNAATDHLVAVQSFLLNLIPGAAAYRNFSQGNIGEGILSLVGDAALFIGGPLAAWTKAKYGCKPLAARHIPP
jgi:hypothetical protein